MTSRSTEFWLHDGSIVVVVEGTLFRVHQTILGNHSEIFSDLFSLPQPPSINEADLIEGCQTVELQDKAKDFLDLLKAIYHPSHFEQLSPAADLDTVLSFISGILRLSTKYVIHGLRKRCVSFLEARFPTSYHDYLVSGPRPYASIPVPGTLPANASAVQDDSSLNWPSTATFSLGPPTTTTFADGSATTSFLVQPHLPQQHQSRSRRHSENIHRDRDHYRFKLLHDERPPKPKPSSVMRAIVLAIETNVLTILPYAYYLLARTSEPQRLLSHSSSLSWRQKAVALVGRAQLHGAEISFSYSFLSSFVAAPTCSSPGICSAMRGPLAEWASICTKGRGGPEPLRPWDRWDRLGVCAMCVSHARRRHERGLEEVWEKLPSFFELETWDKLKDGQEL